MKQVRFCPGCGHIPIAKATEKFLIENRNEYYGYLNEVKIKELFPGIDDEDA